MTTMFWMMSNEKKRVNVSSFSLQELLLMENFIMCTMIMFKKQEGEMLMCSELRGTCER